MTQDIKNELVKSLNKGTMKESHHYKLESHRREVYYPETDSCAWEILLLPTFRYIFDINSIINKAKHIDNSILIYLSTEKGGCLILM